MRYSKLLHVVTVSMCFMTQACVGFVSIKPSVATFKNPDVAADREHDWRTNKDYYKTDVGRCGDWYFKDSIVSKFPLGEPNTVEELEKNCGRPDKIRSENGKEIWVYNKSTYSLWNQRFVWYGIIPVIIIVPIPLVIPVGRSQTDFTIENGSVVLSEFHDNSVDTNLCGPLVLKGGHGLFLLPGCM